MIIYLNMKCVIEILSNNISNTVKNYIYKLQKSIKYVMVLFSNIM